MVKGVGTDILSMQRIRNILEGDSEAFIRNVFTKKEKDDPLSWAFLSSQQSHYDDE